MLFYLLKSFLNDLLPDRMLVSNMRLISDINSNDNLMEKRKANIINNSIFPKDIAKIINDYDYHLEGKSYTFIGHRKSVNCIAVLPDGRIVSGSGYQTIKIWNLLTGRCDITLKVTDYWVTSIAVLLDGRIACGEYELFRIWNLSTKKCEATLTGHYDEISCLVTLPDGRLVSGSYDGRIIIWNIQNSKPDIILGDHGRPVHCISVLPDKRIVSCAHDGLIKIWNTQAGSLAETFDMTIMSLRVSYIATLLDGRILSTSNDGFKIWDLSTGLLCDNIIYQQNDCKINCISVLPDGHIVCGCRSELKILDPLTGNCTSTLSGHNDTILCVIVLPDGRIVSGSHDTTLKLWS